MILTTEAGAPFGAAERLSLVLSIRACRFRIGAGAAARAEGGERQSEKQSFHDDSPQIGWRICEVLCSSTSFPL
jgi:hypothetical protein